MMNLQSSVRCTGVLARLPALVLFLALSAASAIAQEIRGSVLDDSTFAPIPNVVVTAINDRGARTGQSVRTDSAGLFVITGVSGRIQLRAQRVGYAVSFTEYFDVSAGATINVEMFMQGNAAQPMPVIDQFERRMSRGHGTFITWEEIQRRRPRSLADLLMGYPGFQIIRGPATAELRLRRAPSSMLDLQHTCTPRFYLDGVQLTSNPRGGTDPVMMLTGEDLYAVELYRSRATVPARFLSRGSQCGVIVVWTLRAAPPPV